MNTENVGRAAAETILPHSVSSLLLPFNPAATRCRVPVKTTIILLRSTPYFPLAGVEESVRYYERVPGFHRDLPAGDPPQFAISTTPRRRD